MSDKTPLSNNGQNMYSRRRFIQVAASVTTTGALLAACSQGEDTKLTKAKVDKAVPGEQVTATVNAAKGKTYFPSGDPRIPDAYTAPLPPYQSVQYVPGRGGTVRSVCMSFLPLPAPKDQNKYWQELNKRLNVDWQPSLIPATSYPDKVGTLLASGDMPELFLVDTSSSPAVIPALQQGAFTDLTEYLSGDGLKDYPNISRIAPNVWKNISFEGKIYGVPRPRALIGVTMLWRNDWAKKAGMEHIQNGEDFFKVLQYFTKNDPDGNKKADTWGLGYIYGTASYIFQMFGAPNGWRQDSSGKLVNSVETEEFKAGMGYLHRLYAAGLFHPDSFTQTITQAKNGLIAGKFGGYVDGYVGWWGERSGVRKVDPNGDITVLLPVSGNGNTPVHHMGTGHYGFAAIPSQYGGDREKVKELLRIMDYLTAPIFSSENDFLKYGVDGVDNKTTDGKKVLTDTGQKDIGELVYIGNSVPAFYNSEEPDFALMEQKAVSDLIKMGVSNAVTGLYSPTATKQGAKMSQIYNDHFLRIVKGLDPLSSIEQWRNDWKKNGGDQMRKEYEEALSKKS
ncbi:extracellular solute-binding protein [Dictyobacter aurantiacus]|uniref:Sugar ABC transporter substrate-binding protein n=1 Tax=Dictyobacter aurantiacus TaxID=1936993 RepID=A0A401ZT13_9CHLR|nr:extracellular solute-binding protein [Dictyobacter aurantiacus]GCE10015.1 sugar ABC transporter substrate-binding protein [Dictyobacter aurantiacus]